MKSAERETMKQIVFLATYWGAKYGGVNTFNFDLCKAVAQMVQKEKYQVICVYLKTDKKAMTQAKEAGVKLVPIETGEKEFDFRSISGILSKNHFNQVAWWVGHDLYSGPIALTLRDIYKGSASRAALINHINCEANEGLKSPDTKLEKLKTQRYIFQKADSVFGVGPDLKAYANSISKESATLLIPGLIEKEYEKLQESYRFKVITLGRLDAVIKQLPLSVKAFSKAHDRYKELYDKEIRNPVMTVYGVSEDADGQEKLSEFVKEYTDYPISVNPFPYNEDRQEIWSEMIRYNLCLMPSLYEGFGLAGWEAIGLGIPLILTRESGLFRLLTDLNTEDDVQPVDITKNEDRNIEQLYESILNVYRRKEKYNIKATELREKLLLKKGYKWKKTAQDFLEAIGIEHNEKPQSSSSDNQHLFDFSNYRTGLLKPYSFKAGNSQEEGEFQGRNLELEWLKKNFNKVAASSKSRTLLVEGETGIGKTRLIRFFAEELVRERQAHVVIRGFNKDDYDKSPDRMFSQLAIDVCYQYSEILSSLPIIGERITHLYHLMHLKSI